MRRSCSNGGETCAGTGECCQPSNPAELFNACQIPVGQTAGTCGTVRSAAASPGLAAAMPDPACRRPC